MCFTRLKFKSIESFDQGVQSRSGFIRWTLCAALVPGPTGKPRQSRSRLLSGQGCDAGRAAQGVVGCLMGLRISNCATIHMDSFNRIRATPLVTHLSPTPNGHPRLVTDPAIAACASAALTDESLVTDSAHPPPIDRPAHDWLRHPHDITRVITCLTFTGPLDRSHVACRMPRREAERAQGQRDDLHR